MKNNEDDNRSNSEDSFVTACETLHDEHDYQSEILETVRTLSDFVKQIDEDIEGYKNDMCFDNYDQPCDIFYKTDSSLNSTDFDTFMYADEFVVSCAEDGTQWILPRLSQTFTNVCLQLDDRKKSIQNFSDDKN